MIRDRALRVILGTVGLFFTAGIYPLVSILWHRDPTGYTDAMMLSLYFVLGILLLLALRNPSEHRSLIFFAAWSSFAHAAVMTIEALRDASQRELLLGVYIFVPIGIALLVLAPAKPEKAREAASGGSTPATSSEFRLPFEH